MINATSLRTILISGLLVFSPLTKSAIISMNAIADGTLGPGRGIMEIDLNSEATHTGRSGWIDNRSIYKFDLSSISNNATILNATLSLYTTFIFGANASSLELINYLDDAVIDEGDYSTTGTTVASLDIPRDKYTIGELVNLSLSDLSVLNSAISGASTTYLNFRTQGTGGFIFDVASLENTRGFTPASLIIEYSISNANASVPAPGALVLFVAGLTGLAASRMLQVKPKLSPKV